MTLQPTARPSPPDSVSVQFDSERRECAFAFALKIMTWRRSSGGFPLAPLDAMDSCGLLQCCVDLIQLTSWRGGWRGNCAPLVVCAVRCQDQDGAPAGVRPGMAAAAAIEARYSHCGRVWSQSAHTSAQLSAPVAFCSLAASLARGRPKLGKLKNFTRNAAVARYVAPTELRTKSSI